MFKEGDGKVLDGIEDLGCLFNGVHLYRKPNTAGGHTYYTDECGTLSEVWDTCLTNESTLLAVLLAERQRKYLEQIAARKQQQATREMEIDQAAATGGSFLNPIPTNKVE